jgi:hypothetical protein
VAAVTGLAGIPLQLLFLPMNLVSLLGSLGSVFPHFSIVEAWTILGSCWPGALFAKSTPGIEVVLMAMLPFFATTVPGAGLDAAAVVDAAEFSFSRLVVLPFMLELEGVDVGKYPPFVPSFARLKVLTAIMWCRLQCKHRAKPPQPSTVKS